jgi:PDZ domain
MKLKLIGSILGVLVAVGLIGVGTIWAQAGGQITTLAGAVTNARVGGQTDTQPGGAVSSQDTVTGTRGLTNTARIAMCDQFMTALAGHLNVTVDVLAAAGKATAKDMIDQAVKDGRLTAEQATAAKTRIDQAQGNCAFGLGGFRGRGGPGGFPGGGPGFPGGPKGNPGGPRGGPKGNPAGPRGGKVITGTRGYTGTRAFDGATLTQVVANSPAAKAGLQVGDVILAIGGQNIDIQHPVDALIRAKKPGDAVDVKYQHGSETKTVSVTLGAQPNNAAIPYVGVQFEYRRSTS